jgi:hypothetical protein
VTPISIINDTYPDRNEVVCLPILMKNPYEKKRQKKVILDEEEYIEKLESIIERDYFPDSALHKHEHQQENINEIDSISVNKFFEIYNSEDNESFEVLQEKDLAAKRRKFHWLYESPGGKSAGMLMWYHQNGNVLTIEEREKMDKLLECPTTVGDDRPNGCETWRFRVRNQLMFPPELEASKDTCLLPSSDPAALARLTYFESGELDSQPTSETSLVTVSETAEALRLPPQKNRTLNLPVPTEISPIKLKQKSAEEKLMPPPSIVPQNTRLVEKPRALNLLSSSPLEAPHTPSSVGTDQGNAYYRSVCMTPSPFPEVGSCHLNSPLMTWGEICGTPNVLTSESSNPFHISDMSVREKRARLLDTNNNQRNRKSSANSDQAKKTQTNKLSRLMKTPLTPAGRALAAKLSTNANATSEWGTLERPQSSKRVKKETIKSSPRSDPIGGTAIRTDTSNLLHL